MQDGPGEGLKGMKMRRAGCLSSFEGRDWPARILNLVSLRPSVHYRMEDPAIVLVLRSRLSNDDENERLSNT